ncbi:MAG: S8 family serine peptidase [candidate division Zixibacteria bacterium]|nr:S8 family serine peptidase [candidate division Zixibacteria bacterium]
MKYVFSIGALFIIMLNVPSLTWGDTPASLTAEPLVLEKPQYVISEKASAWFAGKSDRPFKVWVFFTDKGVFNGDDFARAVGRVTLSDHVAKRRAKNGIDEIVFADLPVASTYTAKIVDLGAELRRVSRWLNAASFIVTNEQLDAIAALPFVHHIDPVATFSRVEIPNLAPEESIPEFQESKVDALNYGPAFAQMNMIKVPPMHELGYDGEGVILAMLDTGFRKSHYAFQKAYSEGRVLAEYDFIFDDGDTQNEEEDNASQHNHGTYIWSTSAGYAPGAVIGPAYGATFILAKTEDVRSEQPIEEDNWAAAMEWADSLGADVITSSLGYSDWYFYSDFDGQTATITIAANTATALGIVVCNSMGNEGTLGFGSLTAPADAFEILAVGAVDASKIIASFSSRGPTYDGRLKPEVCAMGVSTRCATATADNTYGYINGTSLSTPLVAGAATLLLQAHPEYTTQQVRRALMLTADNAATPDSTYGWGIINLVDAYNWGANFTADTLYAYDSLTVQFTDSSLASAANHVWYFGDGASSTDINPVHTYTDAGSFDVTLVIDSDEGQLQRVKHNLISVFADTLTLVSDAGFAGYTASLPATLSSSQELISITLPLKYSGFPVASFDSVRISGRAVGLFDTVTELYRDDNSHELAVHLSGTELLTPGVGEIARLYFTLDSLALSGDSGKVWVDQVNGYDITLTSAAHDYVPVVHDANVITQDVLRGDANNSGTINLLDILWLIDFVYQDGPAPFNLESGDYNADGEINLLDILDIIDILYG